MSNQDRAEGVMLPNRLMAMSKLIEGMGCLLHKGLAHDADCWACTFEGAARLMVEAADALATPQAPGADTPGGRGDFTVTREPDDTPGKNWPDVFVVRNGDQHDEIIKGDSELLWEFFADYVERRKLHPAESSGGDAVDESAILTKALANSDWYGPAAHFKPEEEVIQTRVLRLLLRQAAIASGAECGG